MYIVISMRSNVPVKRYNKKTASIYCTWSDLDSNEDLLLQILSASIINESVAVKTMV
jgi:hypothetical protein